MNPKRILIALTLAIIVSGLCTWLVSRKLTRPPAVQVVATAKYAVPTRSIQAGEVLRPDNIELLAWPGSPIDGAYSHTGDILGREVLFPLAKGQPILDRDLSAANSGTGLASKIPDGMRAVALHTDEVVGVAGFLVPGSHLDVLVTYRPEGSPDPLTTTVVQNVVALASGHQLEPDPEGKITDATVITLLLTPEESQRAVLASTQGAIHFILRNGGDVDSAEVPPTLLSQLSGRPVAAPHTAAHPMASTTPAPPKRHEIETILGGESTSTGPQNGGTGQ